MTPLSELLPPKMLDALFAIRAPIVRFLKPKEKYFMFSNDKKKKSTEPLSRRFGFDRGTPIDRYYIEKFLSQNSEYIKGDCLEVHDTKYIKKYGGTKVEKADALDIDTNNKLANVFGDLRDLPSVKDNTYDCLVITQTFGMIDDCVSAVGECYRILKPGGVILGTAVSMGPMGNPKHSFWRFTTASIEYIFGKFFKKENLHVESFGNALAGQASWVGVAREELTEKELDYNDPHFPLAIGFIAVK
jgi:hypothetical protein